MIAGTQTSAPVFTHEQVMRVMWGVALCIFLSALDQTIVVPAVPAMAGDLKGFGQLSWIVAVYLLTSASIVVFPLASLLCAMATSLMEMAAFRALQGIGGAGLIAMSHAVMAD